MPFWAMSYRPQRRNGCDSTGYPDANSPLQVDAPGNRLKMIWIYAVMNAAKMVNIKTWGDRSHKSFIRHSVGESARIPSLSVYMDRCQAISFGILNSSPQPATRRIFRDVSEHSVDKWLYRSSHISDFSIEWFHVQYRESGI